MTAAVHAPAGRLAWADAAKGLLIILVVFWHVVLKTYLQIDWRIDIPIPGAWGLIADVTHPVRMPLFFLISGCFAAGAVARPWAAVFRGRVVRYLYLYLLWTLIHTVTMWAFPDFPTLIPRGLAEFFEAITISPPNAWYLYALALYFIAAKGSRRLPSWVVLTVAASLSVAVAAGLVDIVSNRGSLIANLLFFLLGVRFSAQIQRFAGHARPLHAAAFIVLYLAVFAIVRVTGSEAVPGVWPTISLIGVVAGVAVAPLLARTARLGQGLTWLGARTLPIYVIHMPILALADAAAVGLISDARMAVQLAAAVTLPILLTASIILVSTTLGQLIARDRLSWLLDLPERHPATHSGPTGRPGAPTRPGRRLPWRTPVATLTLILVGIGVSSAAALPPFPSEIPKQPAARAGEVSVGATGDILLYDVEHTIPADNAASYLDNVRPWFAQDIVTGNLEQAISDDTGYDKCGQATDCLTFRSDPAAARGLADFDILNLANNHTRDFGQAGYDNTRTALEIAGIRAVGDRNEIAYTQVGDTTVAIVGFTSYTGFNRVTDLRHLRTIVRTATEHADIVIVHAHMGAEGPAADAVTPGTETMYGENRGDPIAFAHAAIDAGADSVIGHGPHVLRGMEWYGGRLIAYSLGNFGGGGVFGKDASTRYGAYLALRFRSDGTIITGHVQSVRFDYGNGVPLPDSENRAAELINEKGNRDFPQTAAIIGSDGALTAP